MNKTVGTILAASVLAGCGGSSGKAFVGVTDVTIDAQGNVAGASGQSLSIVDSDIGSFGHGFVRGVDATVIGNSGGAAAGDTGNFVASGIVDGFDVGAAYVSGTATYSGEYAMTVVTGYEQSSNPDNWNQEVLTGAITARIELHTAIAAAADPDHGHSHDVDVVELSIGEEGDVLFFDEVIIYSPKLPAEPSTAIHTFNGGVATVGTDTPVDLRGEVAFGSDGLIASFRGSDRDVLVAGGFGLEASDTSNLNAE